MKMQRQEPTQVCNSRVSSPSCHLRETHSSSFLLQINSEFHPTDWESLACFSKVSFSAEWLASSGHRSAERTLKNGLFLLPVSSTLSPFLAFFRLPFFTYPSSFEIIQLGGGNQMRWLWISFCAALSYFVVVCKLNTHCWFLKENLWLLMQKHILLSLDVNVVRLILM